MPLFSLSKCLCLLFFVESPFAVVGFLFAGAAGDVAADASPFSERACLFLFFLWRLDNLGSLESASEIFVGDSFCPDLEAASFAEFLFSTCLFLPLLDFLGLVWLSTTADSVISSSFSTVVSAFLFLPFFDFIGLGSLSTTAGSGSVVSSSLSILTSDFLFFFLFFFFLFFFCCSFSPSSSSFSSSSLKSRQYLN